MSDAIQRQTIAMLYPRVINQRISALSDERMTSSYLWIMKRCGRNNKNRVLRKIRFRSIENDSLLL